MAQVDQLNDIQVREIGRQVAALLHGQGRGLKFDEACDAIFQRNGIKNGHELRPAIGKFFAECKKRRRAGRQTRAGAVTQKAEVDKIADEFVEYFKEVLVPQIVADQEELRRTTNEDICPVE